jgi:hypothetical protein
MNEKDLQASKYAFIRVLKGEARRSKREGDKRCAFKRDLRLFLQEGRELRYTASGIVPSTQRLAHSGEHKSR